MAGDQIYDNRILFRGEYIPGTDDVFDDQPIDVLPNYTVGLEFIGKHIEAYIPRYETAGSAGADLRADIPEPIEVVPGKVTKFGTGIKLNIPHGLECQIRSRSGLCWKYGASIAHGVGTVDSDYTGELMMMLTTVEPFIINPGDRVAQMIFAKVEQVIFDIEEILEKETRGSAGFGSTGTI
jgi:dUTP pyrophosphatase